jgi:hypothetical protein
MLEPYFQAIHHSGLGEWMRGEIWRVPAVEFVHLIGLVLLFGSLLAVNLRLFGLALERQPVHQVAADVAGLQRAGLMMMVASGAVLFVTSAMKCYTTESFWWKMGFLAAAVLFQFLVHSKLVRRPALEMGTRLASGAASLFLWGAVLLNGMWTLLN